MTQIIESRLAELQSASLDKGSHNDLGDGACAMEWVSYLADEDFTDAPACTSPVLRKFTIGLNDAWDDTTRQQLKPYLVRMIGTAGDGQDEVRSYMALDWLIRTYTPAWLNLAGLTAEATALRDLPRIVDKASAAVAVPVICDGRDKAVAAAAGSWSAAWAAETGAWAAAGSAAGAAAWSAGSPAWSAAQAAARAAAWTVAESAAWSWSGSAAWTAEMPAPTITTLQASALDLLNQMINPKAVSR